MKAIRILAVALLTFAFSLTSCEKFFEVQLDDQATLKEVFSQYGTAKQYLVQLYSYIPLEEEIVGSHGWVVPRSDEAQYSWYQWVYYLLYKTGNYSSATPSSATYFNYWPKFYEGISQCTIFMDNFVDLSTPEKNQDMTYMKAEARFLRAYFYFCMFRQYGPVFLWYDQTPDPAIAAPSIDRHTVDENVNFMVKELELAAEGLPASFTGKDVGRVTKGAALALRSRILLYAASPLYNGCDLYKGQMQNRRGDYLFPQTANPDKWEAAAKAAEDVIDLSLYSLYEDTSETDPFRKGAASYQGINFQPWNIETIWGWWWRTSSGYGGYGTVAGSLVPAMPPNFNGVLFGFGGIAPSLKLVDSYPMWNSGRYPVTGYQGQNDLSKPIVDPDSGYTATGFTDNYTQPLVDSWAGTIKAHNSCVGRDPRFYASVVPNGFWWPNRTLNKKFTCFNNASCTSPWHGTGDCLRAGYVWRRLVKNDMPLSTNSDYPSIRYVYPAFRMAEIYLNYAEACNEKPQRDAATAIEYLNKVRNRVGLNNIEVAYPGIANDQELLRWCIQKERMVEFGMEAMRHYDACRWMIAKTEYPGANWTLKLSSTTYEGSYDRTSGDFIGPPNVFRDKDYLFPISSLQLAEMTNMTQNYGF